MARKVGLDRDDVITAGLAVLDEAGPAHLTLRAVADRLGVRAPSLYSHVDGIDGLRRLLAVAVTRQFGEALGRSVMGRSGDDALEAFARTYRRWALDHPGRYELTLLPLTEPAERRAAGRAAYDALNAVLAGYGLTGTDAARAGRALRAALHGFASLEAADNLGRDSHDASFEHLVRLLVDGIRTASAAPSGSARTAPGRGASRSG